ncbi:urease accessory protein [Sulfitobacter undariae]|uniref:Urease accessory protein UreD n=1 Tax=Sulfitobacter undariae TaxID=1563671 RepID=A0A7W6H1K5_9RHOB|nr:urease accessory protein [Sulfitobacter undariae]
MPTASTLQPRAIGSARLSVYGDAAGKTRLRDLRQSGSLKLVFPQTHSKDAEVILVNTAGGITGGDCFDLDIEVQNGAKLSLTTQAAERAYRAQVGETGSVTSRLSVHDGGCLHWLPQELILYDRCALRRRLDVTLEPQARFLMVEPVVFGRAAMPETLDDVIFRDRIKITQNGKHVYIDGMDLRGDATRQLTRPAIADGAGAMANVIMVASNAETFLSPLRALLPATAGASMLSDGVLVIRHLATDSFELRRTLVPALEHLSNNSLPTSWRL